MAPPPRAGPPPARQSKAKNWCFTWNNYNEDAVQFLQSLGPPVVYLIAGRETSESGTPHLQGFVRLNKRMLFRAVKRLFDTDTIHIEPTRNVPASIEYCKKDGDFFEVGDAASTVTRSGERTDLDAFKEDVKQGNVDLKSLRELHPEVCAKYPRYVHLYVQDNTPPREIPQHELREWQEELKERLLDEPDDRTVEFIVDYDGNSGKTWFAHWMSQKYDNVQVLPPGKLADMAFALDPTTTCLFIDAPRSKQGEYIQYEFLESVKNGYVFSTKYESHVKQLGKCHVVVMMNEQPDETKLSQDRIKVTVVSGEQTTTTGGGGFNFNQD